MILASTAFVADPVWPWSLPFLGWPALVLVTLLIALLTVLTYLVGQRADSRKFLAVLAIRLTALAIAFLLMLRPAVAQREETFTPSKLIILVDSSASMNNKDEFKGQTRWSRAWQLLESSSVKQTLKHLQNDQKVEIVYYQGAESVTPYKPEGFADGKRTDMGQWLHTLAEWHGGEPNVRGVILLSDGADNGTTHPALTKASQLGFAVHALGLGSPKTTADEKDIYFVPDSIQVSPAPVIPAKGKMNIKATVNAPGFSNVVTKLRVYLNDKEVEKKTIVLPFQPDPKKPSDISLPLSKDNKIEVEIDAPALAGDYKVELKIDPVPGELSDQNNNITTYVTVTKQGFSVLWVEGKKRLEPTFVIRHVLGHDPNIHVYYAERIKQKQPPPEQEDWFNFEKQHYDVVVIGDISASRFAGGDKAAPTVFKQIKELVEEKGSGLLMLGGYESFKNGDWDKYADLTAMLPVTLDKAGQVDAAVQVKPAPAGADHYIMKIGIDAEANEQIWNKIFKPLDGMTPIGTVRPEAVTLATDNGDPNKPVMAFKSFGKGRVFVFGGDTTWKAWRKNDKAVEAYAKFWKKLFYWLAQKDKASEEVTVAPDTRRLPAGSHKQLGFTVGLNPDKSKKYGKVTYKVKVIGPNGKETMVKTWPKTDSKNIKEGDKEKYLETGNFFDTNAAGEYSILVDAYDDQGKKINDTSAKARFLTYSSDLENLRPAADHAFLSRLTAAGGGQFHLGSESQFADLLNQLAQKNALSNLSQKTIWPDWNRDPISPAPVDQVAALISSGILFCYLLFAALLCLEWLLRRRWNMV